MPTPMLWHNSPSLRGWFCYRGRCWCCSGWHTFLARVIPIAPQPVGDHGDRFFVEHFLCAKGGHVVFLAVEAGVAGVVEEVDQPLSRGVAGEVGGVGLFALLSGKTVAVEAADRIGFGEHRAAFF